MDDGFCAGLARRGNLAGPAGRRKKAGMSGMHDERPFSPTAGSHGGRPFSARGEARRERVIEAARSAGRPMRFTELRLAGAEASDVQTLCLQGRLVRVTRGAFAVPEFAGLPAPPQTVSATCNAPRQAAAQARREAAAAAVQLADRVFTWTELDKELGLNSDDIRILLNAGRIVKIPGGGYASLELGERVGSQSLPPPRRPNQSDRAREKRRLAVAFVRAAGRPCGRREFEEIGLSIHDVTRIKNEGLLVKLGNNRYGLPETDYPIPQPQ